MNKSTQLKQLIQSNQLEFLMEAHNGLSAKIVQDTGFKGIWASGLSISAALGVRDDNEASWTQILEVCEFMSDATDIPILLDADTGYGNFNNVRRLVMKLEQRNIAGACLEDKLFHKGSMALTEEMPKLADLSEFCGKIKSAKDSQTNSDFVVIARTEAFTAGHGVQQAISRANAYHEAGADAILIHSKKPTEEDIKKFMNEWDNRAPIIIIPSTYYNTSPKVFRKLNISMVIWANHNLRAALGAMQYVSRQLFEEESPRNVETQISPLQEVLRMQNVAELLNAEKMYLPHNND